MLDLDRLAQKFAEARSETEEKWRAVVWGAAFQKLTQDMSDGEVEAFLESCTSVDHIEVVLRFLDEHPERTQLSPFAIIKKEASSAGLNMGDWIKALPPGLGFRP